MYVKIRNLKFEVEWLIQEFWIFVGDEVVSPVLCGCESLHIEVFKFQLNKSSIRHTSLRVSLIDSDRDTYCVLLLVCCGVRQFPISKIVVKYLNSDY